MCEFVVDTKEILLNLKKAKNKLNVGTKICAVVKADAYGFGVKKIYELIKDKVDYFAVARLSEFLELKSFGLEKPCLILSPLFGEDLELAISQNAEITVSSCENIIEISEIAKKYQTKARIHLKVDTGMNRFGFNSITEFKKAVKQIKTQEYISVVGLYSHLFNAKNKETTMRQRTRFVFYKKILNKMQIDCVCHLSSSKGIIDKQNHFDMVRLGFDLYHSDNHKLTCNVVEIKKIKKGETVGYDGDYQAKKDMLIAVCSIGYADGLFRTMKKSYVLINGIKCKILGNICMDSIMVDISKKQININNKVLIFGKSKEKHISVCDLAKVCDTIAYEIYASISKRVKRIYV